MEIPCGEGYVTDLIRVLAEMSENVETLTDNEIILANNLNYAIDAHLRTSPVYEDLHKWFFYGIRKTFADMVKMAETVVRPVSEEKRNLYLSA